MPFPCYKNVGDVVCFNCQTPMGVNHPERSGYSPGTGAYVVMCPTCRMRTYYDLRAMDDIQIGDRVAYKASFLQATQAHELGHRRGVVADAGGVVAIVEWDDGHRTPVLAKNLVLADRLHLEPS